DHNTDNYDHNTDNYDHNTDNHDHNTSNHADVHYSYAQNKSQRYSAER
ncbi:MAG TPA: DUF2796 domain-containing protein, partial [Desulfuromonadales bacterium]|nr:DUF2796 domain-containing protein [Desulfuromonadales bacterium]